MKKRRNTHEKPWLNYTIALCIAILFYLFIAHFNIVWAGLGKAYDFIRPVMTGLIIAYVLNPLVNIYENKVFKNLKDTRPKTAHTLSVVCTVLTVLAGIVLLMVALIPQLIESVKTFIENLGGYINSLQALVSQLSEKMAKAGTDTSRFDDISQTIFKSLTEIMPTDAAGIVGTFTGIGSYIFNSVIGCILAIYFLMDKCNLIGGAKRLFKLLMTKNDFENLGAFVSRCNTILVRYIAADLLDGLIVGLANFGFMTIARMPYAILLSVVVGITNLAPTFGPIVGGAIGALILVLVNPWHALAFLIFTVIIQTLDGYVFKPKLFGNTLGISGLWILICIIVGGKMFGVWGILLSIPFAAISDYVYQEMFLVRLQRRKDAREAEATAAAQAEAVKVAVETAIAGQASEETAPAAEEITEVKTEFATEIRSDKTASTDATDDDR